MYDITTTKSNRIYEKQMNDSTTKKKNILANSNPVLQENQIKNESITVLHQQKKTNWNDNQINVLINNELDHRVQWSLNENQVNYSTVLYST